MPQLDDFNEFSEPMYNFCQARGEWLSEQDLIPQLLDTMRAGGSGDSYGEFMRHRSNLSYNPI